MNISRVTSIAFLSAIVVLLSAGSASAQLGGLKKKAQEKVKKEAEKAVDPNKQSQPTTETEAAQGEAPQSQAAPASTEPGKGPWLNYDFIPGDRVLFYDDLSAEQVGNFPRRFEFEAGNMEVAEWNQLRWLRSSTRSRFAVPLPELLPQKFTLEFDLYMPDRGWNRVSVFGADSETEQAELFLDLTNGYAGLRNYPSGHEVAMGKFEEGAYGQIMHCRVLADGPYMKVYINEKRVANVPKASFIRSNKLYFDTDANDERPMMLANFRVASSDKTIYDALAATGRVATQGILFDSGSDRIRPESTPTLKEIGKMLADHADLRVLIEGHTDNVGDDASNMSLSERRAAAVKDHLIANYSIDAARLESKGFGESKPVAGNETAEGRQNNRRVELVKL